MFAVVFSGTTSIPRIVLAWQTVCWQNRSVWFLTTIHPVLDNLSFACFVSSSLSEKISATAQGFTFLLFKLDRFNIEKCITNPLVFF